MYHKHITKALAIHFIVGMSRGGTTWMMNNLNLHPDIACFGETMFWGRSYVAPEYEVDGKRQYTDHQRQSLADYYASFNLQPSDGNPGALKKATIDGFRNFARRTFNSEDINTPKDLFDQICTDICRREGKQIAVEKTPHHLNWLDRISEHYPEAKFIVMVRNPYDFMLSYKYQGSQKSAHVRNVFKRLYHPFTAALVLRGYIRSVKRAETRYPERTLVLCTEELRQPQPEFFSRVFKFLGVKDISGEFSPVPRLNSSFDRIKKPKLSSADIFWLHLIAGREMAFRKLMVRHNQADIVTIVKSFLAIPLWSIRAFSILRDKFTGSGIRYIHRWLR